MTTPTSPQALARALLLQETLAELLAAVDDLTGKFPLDGELSRLIVAAGAVSDALANPSNLTALVTWAVETEARNAELVKALAIIEDEARQANAVIALNRDGGGQGRVRVATAMHRIHARASAVAGKQS